MQLVCFRDKLISIKVGEIPTPVNPLMVEEHGPQDIYNKFVVLESMVPTLWSLTCDRLFWLLAVSLLRRRQHRWMNCKLTLICLRPTNSDKSASKL